jgi:protein-L-isoaspartate(D-aspartate) O-methyltransferase
MPGRTVRARFAAALAVLLLSGQACAGPAWEQRRAAMVATIEREVHATSAYTGRDRLDDAVMNAMGAVPRHEFVPAGVRALAYENRPLPIGEGQTISQPYIVALMTDLAGIGADSVVLEVGTGSGYQAAVLAEIAKHVYTIEILEPLGREAARVLEQLGYDNVSVRIGDGYAGWPEAAPFDAIVVTAAPETVPAPLVEQLARGGRLVVPVGGADATQSLQLWQKDAAGDLITTDVVPVMFVPFTRPEQQ